MTFRDAFDENFRDDFTETDFDAGDFDDDRVWLKRQAEDQQKVLSQHDGGCIAEAIQDAYHLGHDDPNDILAAELIKGGHSPCRCGRLAG